MIKKIFLIVLIYCALTSCGKKGDPQYIKPETKVKIQSESIYKI